MPKNQMQPLQKLLVRGVREHKPSEAVVPSRFARYSALDLFQRFEVTGVPYKGACSSGYANVGWEIEAGWTGELDFAAFLPSGALAGQIQPKLTGSGSRTDATTIVLQRLPNKIEFPENADGTEISTWTLNGNPVVFQTLGALSTDGTHGVQKTASINIGIDLQLGKGLFDTVDAIDPSDDAGAFQGGNTAYMGWAFGLSGQVKATWMRLVDRAPGQYDSPYADQLMGDFAKAIGPRNERELKIEILKWLQSVALSKMQMTPQIRQEASEHVKELLTFGATRETGLTALSVVLGLFSKLDTLKILVDDYKDSRFNPKTSKLKTALTKFADDVKTDSSVWGRLDGRANKQILAQIDWYLQQLAAIPQSDTPIAKPVKEGKLILPALLRPMTDIGETMSYLDLFSTTGTLTFSTGPKLIVPLWAQVVVAGSAGLTANVKATAVKSAYRLQNMAVSDGTQSSLLITTQDTRLTYAQAEVSGEAWADIVAFHEQGVLTPSKLNEGYEKLRGSDESTAKKYANQVKAWANKKVGLNTIDYVSAVAYWRYPTADGVKDALLGRGSGVSFGCSVILKRLARLMTEPNHADSLKLRQALTTYLAIDDKTLDDFLIAGDILALNKWHLLPQALILESSFAFPDAFRVNFDVRYHNKRHELVNLLTTPKGIDFIDMVRRKKPGAPRPDALRLRFRMADQLDSTNDRFRLGLIVNLGVGIRAKNIKQAGQEGMIDLYTHYVRKPEANDPLISVDGSPESRELAWATIAQEHAVPPVAVIYHDIEQQT